MFGCAPSEMAHDLSECQLVHVSPVQIVLGSGSSMRLVEGLAYPLMTWSQGAGLLKTSLWRLMRLIRFLALLPSRCGSGLSDLPAVDPELGGTGRLDWLASLGWSSG